MVLKIYTDGACSGNPGPGGWAALLIYGDKIKEISGYEPNTTNNRMELLAVIKALETIKPSFKITVTPEIYSDSSYVVNAINNGWIQNWQMNNWRTSSKDEVKNQDLWQRLIELNARIKPRYIKVKGHSDNKYNNRCDELAVAAYKNHI